MPDKKKTSPGASKNPSRRRRTSSGGLQRRPTGPTPTSAYAVHPIHPIRGIPRSAPTRKKPSSHAVSPAVDTDTTTSEDSLGLGVDKKLSKKERQTVIRRNVRHWVDHAFQKGVDGLVAEFSKLASTQTPSRAEIGAFLENSQSGRNRFNDVPCLDTSRVVLNAANDYIHANYVGTPVSERRFICTQAPLETTAADFWHMVVQEDVEHIVMLCDFVERSVSKSTHYFPQKPGETVSFLDFEVTNRDVRKMAVFESESPIVQTELRVRSSMGTAEVTHFQWSGFPDHSVPPINGALLALLRNVRGSLKPIVIHCSAGIGRSGVAIAVEFLQERFNSGHVTESAKFLVPKLRAQRALCIQTEAQYLYVHRIMLLYFSKKKLLEKTDAFKKFCSDYDAYVENLHKSKVQ
uniref:Protein-tyrosine phosphatase n=1 Tax=Steinernema glaseri TaxID=37863 RepID=A0A1I8ALL6_9BILA